MLAFCAVSAHFCLTPKKSWENSELEGVPCSSGLGMGSRELENRDNFTFHRLVFLVNFSKFPCKFHKLVPRSPQSVLNPDFPFFLGRGMEILAGNVVVLLAVCTCVLGNEVCGMDFVPLKY